MTCSKAHAGDDVVYSAGPAASGRGVLGHWAAAVVPYAAGDSTQRLALSCVLAIPAPDANAAAHPERTSLCWGVAPNARAAWEEPASGWFTRPEFSWDIARGAWGTKADAVSTIVADGSRLSVFRVVLDLPWRGATRRAAGVAFKWQVGNEWLGDVASGGNLAVRTSYASVYHSSGDEDSESSERESESEQDDGTTTDLLAKLKPVEARVLLAAPPAARPPVQGIAEGVESAINPWLALSGYTVGGGDGGCSVQQVAAAEHGAQRSLMHRCAVHAPSSGGPLHH